MNDPVIDVVLITWPNHPVRLEYFVRCVVGLKRQLSASRYLLRWWCSSEVEPDPKYPWCGAQLETVCKREDIALSWHKDKPGLGENMNAGLRLGEGALIFLVQDDFWLQASLDLSDGADYLLAHRDVDLVRYSWPGKNRVTLIEHEDGWRRFDLHGGWPYGDDPHLRRRDFMTKWGWYIEGTKHGASEGDMVHRLKKGGAAIVAADQIYFGHGGALAAVPGYMEHRQVQMPR